MDVASRRNGGRAGRGGACGKFEIREKVKAGREKKPRKGNNDRREHEEKCEKRVQCFFFLLLLEI